MFKINQKQKCGKCQPQVVDNTTILEAQDSLLQ